MAGLKTLPPTPVRGGPGEGKRLGLREQGPSLPPGDGQKGLGPPAGLPSIAFSSIFKRRPKPWTPWPCLPGKGGSIGPDARRLVSGPLPVVRGACGRPVRAGRASLGASVTSFPCMGFLSTFPAFAPSVLSSLAEGLLSSVLPYGHGLVAFHSHAVRRQGVGASSSSRCFLRTVPVPLPFILSCVPGLSPHLSLIRGLTCPVPVVPLTSWLFPHHTLLCRLVLCGLSPLHSKPEASPLPWSCGGLCAVRKSRT